MIEISPDKRPTSAQMCDEIWNEYLKTFLKTSSISSVLRCLYSLPHLTKVFLRNQNNINNNASYRMTKGYLDMILKIKNNEHNKFTVMMK